MLSFFPLLSPHRQKEAPVEGRVKFLSSASSSVDILTMEITKISLWLTKTDINIIFQRMSFPWSIAGMASTFYPEGCPGILWTPVFGRSARKIHLISYNFMGKHAFWTASFQCLAKSLYCVHLIKIRICKWLPFQCTSASRNCQHWFIVHWVGRNLTLFLYSGCFFLFELLALQTIETLHLPLSYHLLPTNPRQGKESQRVQLPHGSIDDMTTKVITQHLTALSKLIRLKLSQWRSQLRWQKKKPVFVLLTFKFYLQF